jgi:hypothetical protein
MMTLGPVWSARLVKFDTWRKQPTTIAGISVASATVAALVNGQITGGHAATLLLGAVISMVLNDNSVLLALSK